MSQEQLIKQFMQSQSRFLGYLIAITRDLDAAEEILQDCAVVVLQGPTDGEIRDFDAWAKEVVRRQALRYMRVQATDRGHVRPMEPMLLDGISRSFREGPGETEGISAERKALRGCIERLPDRSRRLLALRYEKRHSFDEIAGKAGSTAAAIQRALSRVRKTLHDCVRLGRGPAMEHQS